MSDLVDSKAACRILNVSQSTLSRLVSSQEVPSVSFSRGGKRGLRMFSRAALANFLTKRETTSAKRKRTLPELPDGFEKQLDDLNSAVSLVYELLGIIEKAQETGRVECDLEALRHKAQRLGLP